MEDLYMKDFPGQKIRLILIKEDEGTNHSDMKPLSNPADVYEYLRDGLKNRDREFFVVLLLNQKNLPLGVNLVSIGDLAGSIVHPREVFKPAIAASAARIIVAHNHPSGDPTPSREDEAITKTLVQSGDLLGIKVVDHLIIGDDNYYSFGESGKIAIFANSFLST